METEKIIDLSKYGNLLKRRILLELDLERMILAEYSTDRVKQAKLYKKIIAYVYKELLGKEDQPEKVFESISEEEFITSYMNFIDIIELIINREIGPIRLEVYTKKIIEENNNLSVAFVVRR